MGGMGDGMPPFMGGMGGMGTGQFEAMQQARMQRTQAMMQNVDANRNGMIDAEEVQGPAGIMIDRILRGAGVEPKYPMPLSKVQEAMNNRFRPGTSGNNQASSTTTKSSEESKAADSTAPRLVPGFDVVMAKQPTVPGFGVIGVQTASDKKKSGASSDSSSTSQSSATSAAHPDEKTRKYAEGLLKEYDENKNGKLEKNEWSEMPQMRRGLNTADKNSDTIISLDELTEWVVADSRGSTGQSSGGAIASTSTNSTSHGSNSIALTGNSGKSKSYRFRSSTVRLPQGLPDWFAGKDADGDGQVSMHEYVNGDGTEGKAQEFTHYDLNNDGIITPQECLKVDKKK